MAKPLKPDIRTMPPPPGADPAEFAARVAQLRYGGMPTFNASKVARLEFWGSCRELADEDQRAH